MRKIIANVRKKQFVRGIFFFLSSFEREVFWYLPIVQEIVWDP